MKKSWNSPVYAFFNKTVTLAYEQGRPYVEFICSANVCKAKKRGVRRFCDTKDNNSTGNMIRHASACWGREVVDSSLTSDIESVRKGLANKKDGSITAMFEARGKGVVTYSNTAMTKAESRCVW